VQNPRNQSAVVVAVVVDQQGWSPADRHWLTKP
jgi:hypothetical protein